MHAQNLPLTRTHARTHAANRMATWMDDGSAARCTRCMCIRAMLHVWEKEKKKKEVMYH